MKKLVSLLAIVLCIAMMLPLATASVLCSGAASGDAYYVSADGKAGASGTKDDPFASVADAQTALRARISSGDLPAGGITVYLRGGEYSLNGISFTKEDSGTEACPITWCAYENEKPVFFGGTRVKSSDFASAPADIQALLVEAENPSALLALDVSKLGVGQLSQLFINDKRATIARWPDNNFIGQYIGEGGNTIHDDTGRISMWHSYKGARVSGYPEVDYFYGEGEITNLQPDDTYTATCVFGGMAHFFFCNVLDEISVPGEYYIDTEKGMMYLMPTSDFDGAEIFFSAENCNGSSVISADGMQYVTFRGLEFEGYTCNIFDIKNAKSVSVDGCTIHCNENYAINLNGFDCSAVNNTIYNMGRGGIIISGGDREKLIPANNLVDNNLIHDYAQLGVTYAGGVVVDSSLDIGITISHNEIYNSKHLAISGGCSDCIVEYNLIHDVCREASDAGAIYTGRYEAQEQIYRYNIIYNSDNVYGFGSPNGIYVDDGGSFKIAYGNIFYKVGGTAFAIGGGNNNQIYNNIIIQCGTGVNYDSRQMKDDWEEDMSVYPEGMMWAILLSHPGYKTRNFVMRYPRVTLFNISNRRAETDLWSLGSFGLSTIRSNVFINCDGTINFQGLSSKLVDKRDNAMYNGLDMTFFPGVASYDFRYTEDAPFLNDIIGFKSIPVDQIGLRK